MQYIHSNITWYSFMVLADQLLIQSQSGFVMSDKAARRGALRGDYALVGLGVW